MIRNMWIQDRSRRLLFPTASESLSLSLCFLLSSFFSFSWMVSPTEMTRCSREIEQSLIGKRISRDKEKSQGSVLKQSMEKGSQGIITKLRGLWLDGSRFTSRIRKNGERKIAIAAIRAVLSIFASRLRNHRSMRKRVRGLLRSPRTSDPRRRRAA